MSALVSFTGQQVALIKRTVAKDTNDIEFNLFIELCKARGLNPLVRHAFAQVYSAADPKKRQMVIVVSREGQRSLAERTKTYRPDERAPRFEIDLALKDPLVNPAGLVSAEVSVYKHAHGEWFPVTEIAYYEEYAPLKEKWENDRPTGIFHLDPKKDAWKRMPRIMLAKCAEMAVLRKAFPDDFGGLYGEGELDRGEALDLSPSEWAEKAECDDRVARIGGPDTYIIDWMDGGELQAIPGGKLADQVMAFLRTCDDAPSTVRAWRERNRISFQQFWAVHKGEALELKAAIEKAERQIVESSDQYDIERAINGRASDLTAGRTHD